MSLKGKLVVVTGAFGTLGAAMVRTAIRHGARVAAIDRLPLTQAPDLGDAILVPDIDVSDQAAVDRGFARITETIGTLDGLVNVAGTFRCEPLATGSVATWDLLYNVNVRTAVVASKAALPYLPLEAAALSM